MSEGARPREKKSGVFDISAGEPASQEERPRSLAFRRGFQPVDQGAPGRVARDEIVRRPGPARVTEAKQGRPLRNPSSVARWFSTGAVESSHNSRQQKSAEKNMTGGARLGAPVPISRGESARRRRRYPLRHAAARPPTVTPGRRSGPRAQRTHRFPESVVCALGQGRCRATLAPPGSTVPPEAVSQPGGGTPPGGGRERRRTTENPCRLTAAAPSR